MPLRRPELLGARNALYERGGGVTHSRAVSSDTRELGK
jgi:hypothetical protein